MNEEMIFQLVATILGIIVSVFVIKKEFQRETNERLTNVEKNSDEKFKQMNDNTKVYLDSMIELLRNSLETYKDLMNKSIAMNEKHIENYKIEIQREIDRRMTNVCYSDTCNAKHEGINKSMEDSFKAIHKRLDDLLEYLNIPNKRK